MESFSRVLAGPQSGVCLWKVSAYWRCPLAEVQLYIILN